MRWQDKFAEHTWMSPNPWKYYGSAVLLAVPAALVIVASVLVLL